MKKKQNKYDESSEPPSLRPRKFGQKRVSCYGVIKVKAIKCYTSAENKNNNNENVKATH